MYSKPFVPMPKSPFASTLTACLPALREPQVRYLSWTAWQFQQYLAERPAARERTRKKAAQLRVALVAEQLKWESRRDAMEHRFASRLLSRRGLTDDRMSSWETTIDRFLKMICGNLMEALLRLDPTPGSNTFQLAGVPCRTSKIANARLSRTPFR